jgi:hypothetical protein
MGWAAVTEPAVSARRTDSGVKALLTDDRGRLGQSAVDPGRKIVGTRAPLAGLDRLATGWKREIVQRGLVEDPRIGLVAVRQPEIDQFGSAGAGTVAGDPGQRTFGDGQLVDAQLVLEGDSDAESRREVLKSAIDPAVGSSAPVGGPSPDPLPGDGDVEAELHLRAQQLALPR